MKKATFLLFALLQAFLDVAAQRQCLNFNADWQLRVGDVAEAMQSDFDDSAWQQVTLPYAFNGDEAFRKDIVDLTDTVCWYRKHFTLSAQDIRGKIFIEFEGARQGADVWLN
ncbi:MAG: beta-galactosidase, partial [Alloprevotella sp.]|nr:beta-galactosidase [Alloprevotella sp.]